MILFISNLMLGSLHFLRNYQGKNLEWLGVSPNSPSDTSGSSNGGPHAEEALVHQSFTFVITQSLDIPVWHLL